MGDDITIGVTEIVNNIEVTSQPNDQIVDISVIDNADDVTLNITPTVIEINVNKGSSYAKWGTILGTLSDQTDLQNALDLKANLVGGKVPASELPSYVDDIIEVANYAALPTTGETGKIYVTLDNNKIYRWSGSIYIEIAANNAIWGAITGILTDQTDLVTALNAKQNTITLTTSGTTGAATLVGSTLNIPNYTTDISGLVPYTGATTNVDLGTHKLTASDLVINHASGSGVAASITKGGNGEALTVVKSSGTGNAASITGGVTLLDELHLNTDLADAYIASAATWNAKQAALSGTGFVKISGTTISYDNSTYALDSAVVHKTGNETIDGLKKFTDFLSTDKAYNQKIISGGYLPDAGYSSIFQNDRQITFLQFNAAATAVTQFSFIYPDSNTNQFYYVPNASGTLALTSQLHNAVTLGTANGLSLSTQVLSLGLASGSANGALSSTDWTTFNNKQNALTNPITGTGTTNYIPKFTGSTALGNSSIYENSYGDIGIGTTSPISKLHIENLNFSILTLSDTTTYSQVIHSGGNFILSTPDNIRFSTDDEVRMYIGSTGLVGIGTSSPAYKLDINGDMRLSNSATSIEKIYFSNGPQIEANGPSGYFKSGNVYTNTTSANVGIGTTSPAEKLSVSGAIISTGGITGHGANRTSLSQEGGGAAFWQSYGANSSSVGEFYLRQASSDFSITRIPLFINSSGNVGIGTTTPAANLEVYASSATLRISDVGSASAIGEVSSSLQFWASDPSVASGSNASRVRGSISTIFETATGSLNCLAFNVNDGTDVGLPERMRITSGGNVGIGTTSPSYGLDLQGSSASSAYFNITRIGYASAFIQPYTDAVYMGAFSNHPLVLTTNNTERMRITSGGNVGIGTTSPMTKLTVNNGVVRTNTTPTYSSYIHTNDTDDFRFGLATILKGGATGADRYVALESSAYQVSTAAYTGGLNLILNPNGGNVGIGTTSPSALLDIVGASATEQFRIGNTTGGTDFGITVTENASTIINSAEGATGRGIQFQSGGANTVLINSSGNVGIGTTSPSAKLDIVVANSSTSLSLRRDVSGTVYQYGSFINSGSDFRINGNGNVFINADSDSDSTSTDRNVIFGNRGTESMRITSNGELCIGRTSAYGAGWLVNVEGNIYATADIRADGSISAPNLNVSQNNGMYNAGTNSVGFQTNGSARMIITSGGNVGIGTTNPVTALSFADTAGTAGLVTKISLYSAAGSGLYGFGVSPNQLDYVSGGSHVFYNRESGASTERMRITSGGDVLIGTTTAGGAGLTIADAKYIWSVGTYNNTTANAANMWIGASGIFGRSTSSIKYKKDVENYDKGIDIVNKLRPVYYKGLNDGDTVFAGLIAEEVHDLGLTEFVQYAEDGSPDALAYQNMVALLIKAIQEQQKQIEELKTLINK